MRALLFALLLVALAAPAARAQGLATLIADSLEVTADGRLVASGNVEAFFEGTTLSAARVIYDRRTDRLTIEGPILIREPGGAILTADRAEIDPRLEGGILRGARLVLDQRLQIAANRIDRAEGLNALTGAAATSCQVCPGREPLWSIAAAQVVHDEAAGQIWFEDATLRIRGLPVLWVPRLRLPDPGNDRATGLLVPRLRTTDRLGIGLKLPFFVVLGRSRDLTLTPYLSPETRTLELLYRQAFLRGDLRLRGVGSFDDLVPDQPRGLIEAEGRFDLGDQLILTFAGRTVSDDDYLLDYGEGDDDRLESVVALTRVGATSLLRSDLTLAQSLRTNEPDSSLPPVLGALSWERRLAVAGGRLSFGAAVEALARTGAEPGDEARDVARAGAFAGWRREAVLGPGLVLAAEGRAALDLWRVEDDPRFDRWIARAAPAAAATLRWPLWRRQGAVADRIEPIVSLGWSAALGAEPPNEDARLPELDRGNLHALARLPGQDRVEEGGRLSLGIGWTRTGPGFAAALEFGRVLRTEPQEGLSRSSGLAGAASDLLAEGRLDLEGGFALAARTLIGGTIADPAIGKTEARVDWSNARVTLGGAYLFLPEDTAAEGEDRPEAASEWTVDAAWRATEQWSLAVGTRYDAANGRPARLDLGIGWRNECVEVDLSVSRRYTAAEGEEPSTDLGLSVSLLGFSAPGGAAAAPGECRS
jgi:LPS-assembly protein